MYIVTRFKIWYVLSPWRQTNNDCCDKSFDSFSSFMSIYSTLMYSLRPLTKKTKQNKTPNITWLWSFSYYWYIDILFAIIFISFSIILYKYKTMNLPLIYTLKVIGLLTFIYLHLRSSGYYIKWTTKCVTCKLLKICNSHSFYLTRLKYTQFIESMSAYNSCNLKKKRKKVTTF